MPTTTTYSGRSGYLLQSLGSYSLQTPSETYTHAFHTGKALNVMYGVHQFTSGPFFDGSLQGANISEATLHYYVSVTDSVSSFSVQWRKFVYNTNPASYSVENLGGENLGAPFDSQVPVGAYQTSVDPARIEPWLTPDPDPTPSRRYRSIVAYHQDPISSSMSQSIRLRLDDSSANRTFFTFTYNFGPSGPFVRTQSGFLRTASGILRPR